MYHYCQIVESNYEIIYLPLPVSFTMFYVFMILISILFTSTQELYNISCEAGLMVMNIFNFCLFGQVCIPPLFLKGNLH